MSAKNTRGKKAKNDTAVVFEVGEVQRAQAQVEQSRQKLGGVFIMGGNWHQTDECIKSIKSHADELELVGSAVAVATAQLGLVLTVIKGRTAHGQWVPWVERVGMPLRTVQRMMLLARAVMNKGKLVISENPDAAFLRKFNSAAVKACQGKTVTEAYEAFGVLKPPPPKLLQSSPDDEEPGDREEGEEEEPAGRGGAREGAGRTKITAELRQALAIKLWSGVRATIEVDGLGPKPSWGFLPAEERDKLRDAMRDLLAKIPAKGGRA